MWSREPFFFCAKNERRKHLYEEMLEIGTIKLFLDGVQTQYEIVI